MKPKITRLHAVASPASLWPILTVSVYYCGSAFVSWLSMLWDILTRNPELQWFGISPQFRLKHSRGNEGVGHVCFPGDEDVGRPWRGYRRVHMNVGPAQYLELLLNLVLYTHSGHKIPRYYFTISWYDRLVTIVLQTGLENAYGGRLHIMLSNTNCLMNIIDYSAIHLHGYQRLFQNWKCALIAILLNAISICRSDFV